MDERRPALSFPRNIKYVYPGEEIFTLNYKIASSSSLTLGLLASTGLYVFASPDFIGTKQSQATKLLCFAGSVHLFSD